MELGFLAIRSVMQAPLSSAHCLPMPWYSQKFLAAALSAMS